MFFTPLSLKDSNCASFTLLFYLAIGHAPLTRSSVLVSNHPRCPRPGERSIQNLIDAIHPLPFSFACRRHDSLRVLPAFPARPLTPSLLPLLSLTPLLSLQDCEPASDLKNYPSNSHSVELPPALQYFSELFKNPDGLVNDGVQVPMRTVG